MATTHRVSLTIEESYSPSWRLWEGVREMVQNWYDGLLQTRENLRETIYPLKIGIEKRFNEQDKTLEYDASVDLPRRLSGESGTVRTSLGKICFNVKTKCLTLVNHQTELARKVLLLGYTKKPHCEDVIGQFGEGLKIGALALFREGRKVTLETQTDRWFFTVDNHHSFQDTRVLTVIVADRSQTVCDELCDFPTCPLQNLGPEDTCVTISPILEEEWMSQAKKFLFLEPSRDSVPTDQGVMMMDTHMAGQVYVKGVWVNDMKEDGLFAGVDFYRMRLDRDRRAVVHKSDIDHQVSVMWKKALQKKPQWAGHYYRLLDSNNTCDVRHASLYMDDPDTASLVADEFFKLHGQNALPLINTATADLLRKFTHDLKKEVVLCNQALLDILVRSGKVPTADSLLDQHKVSQQVKVPLSSLSEEQMSVLQHMRDIVCIVEPKFTLAVVDIIETDDRDLTMTPNGRTEIPQWMLDEETVAQFFPKSATDDFELWREAQIASRILNRIKPGQEWLNGRADFSIQNSSIVIAALATQSHRKTKPFCLDRHKSESHETDAAMWKEREEAKDDEIHKLQMQLHTQGEEHRRRLNELMVTKSSLEKQMHSKEAQHVDVKRDLERQFQRLLDHKLEEAKRTVNESTRKRERLEDDNQILRKKIAWQDDEHKQISDKLKEESAAKNRMESHLKSMMVQLKEQLRKRLEILVAEMNKEGDYSNSELLESLRKVAEDLKVLEEKKDMTCGTCKQKEKSHIMVPCGHFVLCENCISRVNDQCPICRKDVTEFVKVFDS